MTKLARQLTVQLTVWIAFFAILMVSLAPSISHVLAAAKGANWGANFAWTEICSSTGSKFVALANVNANTSSQNHDSSHPSNEGMIHLDHCPFCSIHTDSLGLPPATAFELPAVERYALHPFLFYRAPRPLFAWSRAQSRAPPSIS